MQHYNKTTNSNIMKLGGGGEVFVDILITHFKNVHLSYGFD